MSALGHKQTRRTQFAMSALPPKADIRQGDLARNGKMDTGAPRVRRGKAAWNWVDFCARRVKTLFVSENYVRAYR